MKHWLKLFIVIPSLVVVLGIVLLSALRLDSPLLNNQSTINIQVKAGDSLSTLVKRWHAQELVEHPNTLLLYARLTNKQLIHRGEYDIKADTSHAQLLKQLNAGKVKQHFITLVEGWTYRQALDHMLSNKVLESSSVNWRTTESLDGYQPQLGMEGMIYPDTYAVSKGENVNELLQRAHRRLIAVLNEEWSNRAASLPYESAYEALIMASIVEKETGQDNERAKIAGVFVRRLMKGMRLQTDPTVIYGLGEQYQGNIKRVHLRTPSAYNTYMIHGLPPTPIALVGREAIHAALHPLDGDSLYFVAKGDGSHYFSATLAEHEAAVKEYQIKRRAKQYRSSPQ